MSGFYKKAVVWLGLNEEYPDDVAAADPAPARPSPTPGGGEQLSPRPQARQGAAAPARQRPTGGAPNGATTPSARAIDSGPTVRPVQDRPEGTVRVVPMEDDTSPKRDPSAVGTVRVVAVPKTVKPKVVVPQSFNDAQLVADTFREPKPVIVNMQSADRDLARRLIDFSSGLCYGLGGQMEKVAKDVYLLTPDEIEVAEEDRDNF